MGISLKELNERADALHENNPMMGHRGVRLGITYPEVTEMQVRAIFEASAELLKEGKKPFAEIMIPVLGHVNELKQQFEIVQKVHAEVCEKFGMKKIPHLTGTMIEIPRFHDIWMTRDQIAYWQGMAEGLRFALDEMER